MAFSSTWILSLKVVMISTGFLSMAMALKSSVPLLFEFSVSQIPLLWNSFLSYLKPPYLYVIINCIIITIVASSRFHKNHDSDADEQPSGPPQPKLTADPQPEFDYQSPIDLEFRSNLPAVFDEIPREDESEVFEKNVVVNDSILKEIAAVNDGNDEFTLPLTTEIPSEYLSPAEKPLVSSRFSHRPVEASPEGGKALRVTKPKRHETLENTWKKITEGRGMPLNRHMKKPDTWENHGRQLNVESWNGPHMKKSETFRDRTNYNPLTPAVASPPSSVKLRKEPSLSQDELNKRVEAFINKFNEEMRKQRQESLNQYNDFIGRGSN